MAAKDYLQFVTLDEFEEIVHQYNEKRDELETELEKVEESFAEKLEKLVKYE